MVTTVHYIRRYTRYSQLQRVVVSCATKTTFGVSAQSYPTVWMLTRIEASQWPLEHSHGRAKSASSISPRTNPFSEKFVGTFPRRSRPCEIASISRQTNPFSAKLVGTFPPRSHPCEIGYVNFTPNKSIYRQTSPFDAKRVRSMPNKPIES